VFTVLGSCNVSPSGAADLFDDEGLAEAKMWRCSGAAYQPDALAEQTINGPTGVNFEPWAWFISSPRLRIVILNEVNRIGPPTLPSRSSSLTAC
jgi:hypothetical protein